MYVAFSMYSQIKWALWNQQEEGPSKSNRPPGVDTAHGNNIFLHVKSSDFEHCNFDSDEEISVNDFSYSEGEENKEPDVRSWQQCKT
ncbi:hypothetical protein ACET3Z_013193 [Daucus carota]